MHRSIRAASWIATSPAAPRNDDLFSNALPTRDDDEISFVVSASLRSGRGGPSEVLTFGIV